MSNPNPACTAASAFVNELQLQKMAGNFWCSLFHIKLFCIDHTSIVTIILTKDYIDAYWWILDKLILFWKSHKSLSKYVKLLGPFINFSFDRFAVVRTGYGWDVDITIIQNHLNVIHSTKDVNIFLVFVRDNNKLKSFPWILNLRKTTEFFS